MDRAIAALADRQHGVVTRRQLRQLGVSDSAITRRLDGGRLHVLHHGVFSVGHTVLGERGRWMGAVLSCGSGAALSHASAAALWEMRFNAAHWIDVSTPRTGRRSRDPIRIHRPRTLTAEDLTTRHRIPVTTAARTILDMAGILQRSRLERLLDQAEIRELADYPALADMARSHPNHRGAAKLLATLNTYLAGEQPTHSDLEARFRQICHDHRLPQPRVNHQVAGKEVDFLFAGHRLIVEIDSWRYHRTRRSFESDRARDVLTALAGYRTVRFTDRQLTNEHAAVARALRALFTAAI